MSNSILISTQGPAGPAGPQGPAGPEGSYDVENSLTENGYQKLPGGVILQWGRYATSITSEGAIPTITFPIQFPNACLNIVANGINTANNATRDLYIQPVSWTTSGVKFYAQAPHATTTYHRMDGFFWQAIGY